MTLTMRLLASGVRDVSRRRWLIAYMLFYLITTDLLVRFGGSGGRAVLSLANVVLGLVPLVSVVFGTMYLYHAREFIQMMLAQPVGRRALFAGLYGGLALPLAGAFLMGVALPLAWHGAFADAAGPVAVLLAVGASLALVFTGLAFVIALACQDRAAGLAVAILTWLGATALYDGIILLAIVVLRDYPLERPLLTAMLANPVDLGRVLLLRQFDLGALAGYTGAAFERFFGTSSGTLWSVAAIAMWTATPFVVGLRQFSRKDF